MLDPYGNPVVFLREKRAPVSRAQIPHRAMMFTGYYRPARRSYNADQATGVFAQGNAVSGGSYLGGVPTTRLDNGPEPIDEPEVSRAQAEAAPEVPEEAPEAYPEEQNNASGFPVEVRNSTSFPYSVTYCRLDSYRSSTRRQFPTLNPCPTTSRRRQRRRRTLAKKRPRRVQQSP